MRKMGEPASMRAVLKADQPMGRQRPRRQVSGVSGPVWARKRR